MRKEKSNFTNKQTPDFVIFFYKLDQECIPVWFCLPFVFDLIISPVTR